MQSSRKRRTPKSKSSNSAQPILSPNPGPPPTPTPSSATCSRRHARGRRYSAGEVRGIGAQVAGWLGGALYTDAPLTVAAAGDEAGAQRLYQLLHDYLAAHDRIVVTVDWSGGVRALPRAEGKPLIYAGGGFGTGAILAHRDGAVVVAVADHDAEGLDAEARRLAVFAGRAVHVVPLGE